MAEPINFAIPFDHPVRPKNHFQYMDATETAMLARLPPFLPNQTFYYAVATFK
jgi:hypothetical protein